MLAAILRTSSWMAAVMLLTACEIPSIDSCYSCIDAPTDRAIPAPLQAKVRLIHGGGLPTEAHQVFYFEECGIDCRQQLRFDAPSTVAEAFVHRMLPQATAEEAATAPLPTGPVWWTAQNASGTQSWRSSPDQPWPLTIVTMPLGNEQTRVWLSAHQT